MDRINEVLAEAIKRQGGNKAEIARRLKGRLKKISGQQIGYYEKGRTIPRNFVIAWKEEFEEDLEGLCETDVSRGNGPKREFWDHIKDGNYIGMHDRVWAQIEMDMESNREVIKTLSKSIADAMTKLTRSGN
jgi:hypothetical protein